MCNATVALEIAIRALGLSGEVIEMCAAMGLANLGGFDEVIETNRRNHAAYQHALADIPGIKVLDYDASERNSHHYIVLEVGQDCRASRDEIVEALHAENILARKVRVDGYCSIIASGAGFVNIGSHVHIAGYCGIYASNGVELGDFSGLSSGVRRLRERSKDLLRLEASLVAENSSRFRP